MISAKDIHKHYGNLHVLKGVSLMVNKGEVVSIVGTSGAGKTTLLQILGTLDKADQGEISINNINISTLTEKKIHAIRNKQIGFVFQFHHLLPEFTALENICIPAYIAGETKSKTEEKAKELLGFLGLEQRANHKPAELSGGEQQRIAVARALINNPSIILADEPSGNLDSTTAKDLHRLFFTLREKFQQTFIIVTHNEELANMADRKLTMRDGAIVATV
ncbi:MAG TPA: ABC transporter ATP-binding protein [Bacteroidia bacterium]|jgi:lipoprotein-releasing system ATP-binding protein|nr:ABC transporter ATP-binding protein [Bacteroidia bacterium]